MMRLGGGGLLGRGEIYIFDFLGVDIDLGFGCLL